MPPLLHHAVGHDPLIFLLLDSGRPGLIEMDLKSKAILASPDDDYCL